MRQPAADALSLEARGVRASYGAVVALDDISLEVAAGEFVAILGPSGCGKTTLLNVLAGFISPEKGSVRIGGEDVTHIPPNGRRLSMVFQNYALFPHMTVRKNVGYGLRVRRVPKATLSRRVDEVLDLVGLAHLADRWPRQLSGGQQQRVAVARALAVEPLVLLMDEPLSNLDAKLRREMRIELRSLQQRTKTTTVFVTHDQEEALVMSDRVAVMNNGIVEQVGTPVDVYERPATDFVAGFIGSANRLRCSIRCSIPAGGAGVADWEGREVVVHTHDTPASAGEIVVVLRPERLSIGRAAAAKENSFAARLEYSAFVGNAWQLGVALDGATRLTLVVPSAGSEIPSVGADVRVGWSAVDAIVLPSRAT
jgi:ABC-type Fe3+/spermidine/putrescine transport system ATPase subunit